MSIFHFRMLIKLIYGFYFTTFETNLIHINQKGRSLSSPKEDIEEVAVDFQKKVLGLSEAEPAGMMEEVSAAGPAPDMTVGAFAL